MTFYHDLEIGVSFSKMYEKIEFNLFPIQFQGQAEVIHAVAVPMDSYQMHLRLTQDVLHIW